eukprot:TRINITY_DN12029_c0_g1_i1.p1 TRINITY_DN12029_c0_g1~~TRINITY_DN12029_c0_g1_i1.p1  ORF type:complete len:181 (-),score=37.16 TRINITY_DN12029_c0_g1_i1:169-711(-)
MCLRITNQAETKNKEEKEDKDDLDDVDMIGYGESSFDVEETALYFSEFQDPQNKIKAVAYALKVLQDTEITFRKGGLMDPKSAPLISMGALVDEHVFTRSQLRQLMELFKSVKQKPGLRLENNPFFDLVGQLNRSSAEVVGVVKAPSQQLVSGVSRPSDLLNALLQYHQFQIQQKQQQQG